MNRHIEFDTGSALFQMADEYENLVSEPPTSEEGMSKRQEIAVSTKKGAIRLSQVRRGSSPSDSVGGVSFRHLSMLAQIKSSDNDVWESLRKSGHIGDSTPDALSFRLSRMRHWINSPHFPDESRIDIRSEAGPDLRSRLSEQSLDFLDCLADSLQDVEWSSKAIGRCIRESSDTAGLDRKEGYVTIYQLLLGRDDGPNASSIIAEMSRGDFLGLINGV